MNTFQLTESGKHPGGRPSSCTPEMLAKAREYLDKYSNFGDAIPTLESMALHVGVTRKTLYNWIKNEEFLRIYERSMCTQEIILINKGLLGEFNSSLCSMMLSKHGYGVKRESKIVYTSQQISPKERAKLDLILKK